MKAPCYNCEKRQPYCHVNCETYYEYQQYRSKIYKERNKYNGTWVIHK